MDLTLSALVTFVVLLTPSNALLPNYHNCLGDKKNQASKRATRGRLHYFDDCERRGDEEWEHEPSLWNLPRTDEKRMALQHYLGYTKATASEMSREEVEEVTLVWAIDNDIVSSEDHWNDDDHADKTTRHGPICRYDSISDLVVSSASTTIECLAQIWKILSQLMEQGTTAPKGMSAHMIAFQKALWDYDTMVTVLDSIEICKPLLPPEMTLEIDLFHPDYKHAPKLVSPQTHSPVPTLGIQLLPNILGIAGPERNRHDSDDQNDQETRKRLMALFDSADAVAPSIKVQTETIVDEKSILAECRPWVESSQSLSTVDNSHWEVQLQKEPHKVYTSLWATIEQMTQTMTSASSTFVVVPFLDAHTTRRLAVTVNAALLRFDCGVKIANVFHPDAPQHLRSPYATIQLVPEN